MTSRSRDLDPDKQLDRATEEEEKAVTNIIINTTATATAVPSLPCQKYYSPQRKKNKGQAIHDVCTEGKRFCPKADESTDKLCKCDSAKELNMWMSYMEQH